MPVLRCTNKLIAALTYDVEPANPNGTYYRAAHNDELVVQNPDHIARLLATNEFILLDKPSVALLPNQELLSKPIPSQRQRAPMSYEEIKRAFERQKWEQEDRKRKQERESRIIDSGVIQSEVIQRDHSSHLNAIKEEYSSQSSEQPESRIIDSEVIQRDTPYKPNVNQGQGQLQLPDSVELILPILSAKNETDLDKAHDTAIDLIEKNHA